MSEVISGPTSPEVPAVIVSRTDMPAVDVQMVPIDPEVRAMSPIVSRDGAPSEPREPEGGHEAIAVTQVGETATESAAGSPHITSVAAAVSFLISSNPESTKRSEEMNMEQIARLESYGEGRPHTLSFMPSAIGKGIDTVTGAVQAAIPAPLANVAHAAGGQVSKVAGLAADVINNAPTLVLNTIPTAIMSEKTKQLIFVDFNNTLRSFFHTNVLAMPYVFNQTGVVMGLVIMVLVSVACEYATEIFLLAKYALPDPTKANVYGDVPRLTFGDWYPTFNIFYGVIHLVGFQVFAAKNTQVMLRSIFGIENSSYGYKLGMIIPSAIAVPLLLMKSAHNQRPLSIVSNTLVMISVIVLMFYFPFDAFDVSYAPSSVSNVGVAMGVVVYAFTGIGSVVPVERTMPGARYKRLLRPSVAIAFLLLVLFGISGYVSYGGNTCAVITMSMGEGSTKTAVSTMLFIASIAIIPQQLFPLAEILDRRILGLPKLPTYFQLNANFARLVAVSLCAIAAYFVPYYGLLSAISGAIGCSILGFIVPGLLERNRRMRRHPSLAWYEHLIVWSMVGSGFAILVGCSVAALYQIVNVAQSDYVATCF